jgi:hypothetical protein
MPGGKVIQLGSCSICRRPARGNYCKKHEPFYLFWNKKNALKKKALIGNSHSPIIA